IGSLLARDVAPPDLVESRYDDGHRVEVIPLGAAAHGVAIPTGRSLLARLQWAGDDHVGRICELPLEWYAAPVPGRPIPIPRPGRPRRRRHGRGLRRLRPGELVPRDPVGRWAGHHPFVPSPGDPDGRRLDEPGRRFAVEDPPPPARGPPLQPVRAPAP